MASTFNTYPDLLVDGGRLAETVWPNHTAAEAVKATTQADPEAIVLVAIDHRRHVGLAPGGLSWFAVFPLSASC